MNLRTYQGSSMAEALDKLKRDLGANAVILHTRTLKRGGLWGVGARTVVEITASRDARDLPAAERRAIGLREEPTGTDTRLASRPIPPVQGYAARPAPTTPAAWDNIPPHRTAFGHASFIPPGPAGQQDLSSLAAGLRDEMNEIRSMVRQLLNRPAVTRGSAAAQTPTAPDADPTADPPQPETPAEFQEYYTRLLQNAVAEEIARDIIAKARQRLDECRDRIRDAVGRQVTPDVLDDKIQAKLRQLVPAVMMETVERMLPPPGPVEVKPGDAPRIVALVGPTGVGKTTTIAKLAAQFKLRDNKRVGLITTDTYRIAAVEQIKAYADIMSLPLEVVFSPDELRGAIARLAGCDLILIDTSGRSQRDTRRLEDLKAFLDAARAVVADANKNRKGRRAKQNAALPPGASIEVHLLLASTGDSDHLIHVARRFAALGVDRAAFTKIDEAVGLGVVLNVAARLNLQLSYLTTGQDVPDDIEVGHRRRIAEQLLRGDAAEPLPELPQAAPVLDHIA